MEFIYILGILFLAYILWTIIELISLHRFNLKAYNRGVKVFQRNLSFKHINWEYLDEFYFEDLAEYVFLQEYKIGYFVSNISFYRHYSPFFSSNGLPLTIFGKIEVDSHELKLSFYISYRIIALLILFLAFTIFLLISTFSLFSILFVIGLWVILFIVFKVISVFQQGRMLTMVDEIKGVLRI